MFSKVGTDDSPQDEKFHSLLLSTEISATKNPSFHVYYGVASGAVPFLWESHPGTPKRAAIGGGGTTTTTLPPLTPPPSYYFSPSINANNPFAKSSKRNLMRAILRKLKPSASILCFGHHRLALKKALLSV